MKAKKVLFIAIATSALLAKFQNCSGADGHETVSQSSDGILSLTTPRAQIGPNLPFTVQADLSAIPRGSSLLWHHEYSDGLTYCEQTTAPDFSRTTLSCPGSGLATVLLTVTAPDGKETVYSLLAAPNAGLSPSAQLYNMKCSSCHGSLPGSSSRIGITLAQLQWALDNIGPMQFLKNELTPAQMQEIISALNSH